MSEWLPEDHLCYFVSDVVEQLDLSAIMGRYAGEERGYPPYHPKMMIKVLVYAYCIGVPSSRRIARRLREDIAFRVLAANNTPDFRTISDFRKDHLAALAGLFLQVLRLCQKAGLVKLGHVALDGTKIKANASKHKAMSYRRMKETEARLESEVKALLEQAAAVDEEEDRRYGSDRRGDEIPRELSFRESRLKRIREAREALEAEARVEVEKAAKRGKRAEEVPSDKAQRNFTDADSRIMPVAGGSDFVQAYNAQAAVDSAHQIIVAARVTNQPSDRRQAEPMTAEVTVNTGQLPREMSADAGYFSKEVVTALSALGIDVYIPPDKMRHGATVPPAPRGRIPRSLSVADRMRRKLRTKKGRRCYAQRKQLPEPVFGQIKQARGFRQFLLRGIEKTGGEWQLICTGHNLLKLFGAFREGLVSRSCAVVAVS
jgi:transposase